MMRFPTGPLRTSLLALLFLPGCSGNPPPARVEPVSKTEAAKETEKHAEEPTTKVTYAFKGVVKRVRPELGQVVIAHEAIPGFMNAMTMPFTLKNRELLEDVQPDDEVEGELLVEKEGKIVKDYEVTNLVVARPAMPSPKALSLGPDGELRLSDVPKRLEPGETVPDFAMTDQDGKVFRLSDLRGQVVVLTFIYTRCPLPDFCPLMDRTFAELAGKLAGQAAQSSKVRLLSVSFDPEHDTPEVLRRHAGVQGAKPPLWTFAVASHEELAKIAPRVGLTYGPTATEIIHNLCTAVIDPEGKLARLEVGNAVKRWSPAQIYQFVAPLTRDSKPKEAASKD